jgi:rRNA maturation protein Nop10
MLMKAAETERFSPISRFSLQRRAIKSALKLLISMAVPVCGQNGYLSHSGVKKGVAWELGHIS